MSTNIEIVETHGCIVCGRLHTLLVIYDPQGSLLDGMVKTGQGVFLKEDRPLVYCNTHDTGQVERALARHNVALSQEDLEED